MQCSWCSWCGCRQQWHSSLCLRPPSPPTPPSPSSLIFCLTSSDNDSEGRAVRSAFRDSDRPALTAASAEERVTADTLPNFCCGRYVFLLVAHGWRTESRTCPPLAGRSHGRSEHGTPPALGATIGRAAAAVPNSSTISAGDCSTLPLWRTPLPAGISQSQPQQLPPSASSGPRLQPPAHRSCPPRSGPGSGCHYRCAPSSMSMVQHLFLAGMLHLCLIKPWSTKRPGMFRVDCFMCAGGAASRAEAGCAACRLLRTCECLPRGERRRPLRVLHAVIVRGPRKRSEGGGSPCTEHPRHFFSFQS